MNFEASHVVVGAKDAKLPDLHHRFNIFNILTGLYGLIITVDGILRCFS